MLNTSRPAQDEIMPKARIIFYWLATAFVCFVLLFGALSNVNLVKKGYAYGVLDHLGYPRYLAAILGVCKLAATVVFLSPRLLLLKEWAYAGVVILFLAAFVSHVIVGDDVPVSAVPLLFGLVTILSYVLRPRNRRLPLCNIQENL